MYLHHQSGTRPIDGGISPGTGADKALRFWLENHQWGYAKADWLVTEVSPLGVRDLLHHYKKPCGEYECRTDDIFGTLANPKPRPGVQLLISLQLYNADGNAVANFGCGRYSDPPNSIYFPLAMHNN